jgi:hypothetical protein
MPEIDIENFISTAPTNFASADPTVLVHCSGLHAATLLGCTVDAFLASGRLQKQVSEKWRQLVDKPVEVKGCLHEARISCRATRIGKNRDRIFLLRVNTPIALFRYITTRK